MLLTFSQKSYTLAWSYIKIVLYTDEFHINKYIQNYKVLMFGVKLLNIFQKTK